ncbi:MAG: helix-turn-helix domain-containing protein [Planctomycetota bacterium]
MAESTKIRPLSRLFDRAANPLWAIGPDDTLVFLSAACGEWLGVRPEALVGRMCRAAASLTDDPLDYLAATLAPPPGFGDSGLASLTIQPSLPGNRGRRFQSHATRFVRVDLDEGRFTLAVAGRFDEKVDPDQRVAVELRQTLDRLRGSQDRWGQLQSLGDSRAATRLRAQLATASSVRGDVRLQSAPGNDAQAVAEMLHQRSAPGEPVATIDGPLMDAELLDASMGMLLGQLEESDDARATALIRDLQEMPEDAQSRLVEQLDRYGTRLRLLALFQPRVSDVRDPAEEIASALHPMLDDRLCALSVSLVSLAERVDDIPLLASTMLQHRVAAGESRADRFREDALDALVIYPWPGNLLELDEAVGHAARKCKGSSIGRDDLTLAIRSYRPNADVPLAMQTIDLDQEVAAYELKLIHQVLESAENNRAEAARRLGISRARLLRKLDSESP